MREYLYLLSFGEELFGGCGVASGHPVAERRLLYLNNPLSASLSARYLGMYTSACTDMANPRFDIRYWSRVLTCFNCGQTS